MDEMADFTVLDYLHPASGPCPELVLLRVRLVNKASDYLNLGEIEIEIDDMAFYEQSVSLIDWHWNIYRLIFNLGFKILAVEPIDRGNGIPSLPRSPNIILNVGRCVFFIIINVDFSISFQAIQKELEFQFQCFILCQLSRAFRLCRYAPDIFIVVF